MKDTSKKASPLFPNVLLDTVTHNNRLKLIPKAEITCISKLHDATDVENNAILIKLASLGKF